MRRQGPASGKAAARRPKTAIRKRRVAPKAKPSSGRSTASLQEQLDRRTRELNEALEQQTATSDILRAIAATPGDAEGTLRKIAETTARLFDAAGVSFRIVEGDEFKLSASVGQGADQISSTFGKIRQNARRFGAATCRAPWSARTGKSISPISTISAASSRIGPALPWLAVPAFARMVGTPLRTKGSAIGALMVYRNVLQPFTPAELQLLQSFAAQAVIAIENARLLNELRQRTADLTESLEQQTATSEVLRVISPSPGELEPVFRAMLEMRCASARPSSATCISATEERFVLGAEVGVAAGICRIPTAARRL